MSGMIDNIFNVFGAALVPLMQYKGWCNPQWGATISERMGGGDWPKLQATLRPSHLWFHAASVGELTGLVTVLKAFDDEQFDFDRFITTTSEAGKKEALIKKMTDKCCFLPIDYLPAIKRALVGVSPKLWLITETEIWPNLILEMKRRQTPILLFNARISDKSYPRYLKLRYFLKPILQKIDFIIAQTSCDRERLINIGGSPDRIEVGGSTKYDRPRVEFSAEELAQLVSSMGLDLNRPIFVAGSVRPGEDKIVIETFAKLKTQHPELQMIVAPRHAENYDIVGGYLRQNDLKYCRRSQGTVVEPHDVVMLDTMGELAKVYAASTVAFVGGSLVNIGGHNPLEPAAYGKPVVMGKYNANVREVAGELKNQKGMVEVSDENQLYLALERLLLDKEDNLRYGENAARVWLSNQGATKRVMLRVKELLGYEHHS